MKKYPMNRMIGKQSVQGATLIEVLVSVFLLTFGILGLMAAQLRSVSAVSESENRAIAAQAAESLAEAMQMNLELDKDGKRSYDKYISKTGAFKAAVAQASCNSNSSVLPTTVGGTSGVSPCALVGKNKVSKENLARAQMAEFEHILQQMPNTVNLQYTICFDDLAGLSTEKVTEVDAKCSNNAAGNAVIKVLWTTRDSTKETATGIPDTSAQLYYLVLPK